MTSGRWPTRAGRTVLAVLMGAVGAGLLWAAVDLPTTQRPPSVGAGGGATDQQSSTQHMRLPAVSSSTGPRHGRGGIHDLTTGPVLAAAEPVEVSIPKIGVRSRLEGLGTHQDGTMEVPSDPAIAGWYTLGPAPGALGPAVLVGHVTWNGAPAVFFRLGALRRGDLVRVVRTNSRDAVFEVVGVARFDKTRFPTQAVFGGIDHAGLRLITCGGAYDARDHRYLDNVVVFANLVGHRP